MKGKERWRSTIRSLGPLGGGLGASALLGVLVGNAVSGGFPAVLGVAFLLAVVLGGAGALARRALCPPLPEKPSASSAGEWGAGEDPYRQLFDHMLDGFAVHEILLDRDGVPENYRFLAVNPAFERLTGLRKESLLGRTVKDVLPGTERHWIDTYGRVALTGQAVTFENVAADLGRHFEVTAYSPGPGLFACVFADVTARRRAEEALRISEERLRFALEATSDGLWDLNVTTGDVYWSPRAYTLLGYAPEEFPMTLERWQALLHPQDRDFALERIRDVLTGGGEGYAAEYRMAARDGGWRWVLVRGKVMEREPSGAVRRIVGTHADITERKAAEEERHLLAQYLRNIVDSMPSMLVGVDAEGRVTQWNAEAERRTGVSRSAAVGYPVRGCWNFPEEILALLQGALAHRTLQKAERVFLEEKGERRWADVLVYPLVANGVTGAVVRLDDVTERIRLEEMVIQNEKMMSVGGLAAGMAHEINNPLAGVLQGAQNIQRRLSPELPKNVETAEACGTSLETVRRYLEAREILIFLQDIRESGERAADIVRHMLTFSRRSDAVKVPCSLRELVDRALKLAKTDFDLRRRYDFQKILLEREDDPHLPPVPGVVTELEQVLLNLLRNAAQALSSHPAQTTPRIRVVTRRDGDVAVLEVWDNGPGVPEEHKHRIFEPFFTTKEMGVGTGLGLSVSYFIVVSHHGGWLRVDDAPDGGAVFRVLLPLEGGE